MHFRKHWMAGGNLLVRCTATLCCYSRQVLTKLWVYTVDGQITYSSERLTEFAGECHIDWAILLSWKNAGDIIKLNSWWESLVLENLKLLAQSSSFSSFPSFKSLKIYHKRKFVHKFKFSSNRIKGETNLYKEYKVGRERDIIIKSFTHEVGNVRMFHQVFASPSKATHRVTALLLKTVADDYLTLCPLPRLKSR